MTEEPDFGAELAIDPMALDAECIAQPELFFRWAKRAVEAKTHTERSKFAMEVMYSTISADARGNPERYGIAKVTEAAIDAAVKASGKYLTCVEQYHAHRAEAALLDNAVEAFEQRKRMLELLVTLHGQQYFSDPNTPHDLVKVWRERQARQEQTTNDRQKAAVRTRGVSKAEDTDKENNNE